MFLWKKNWNTLKNILKILRRVAFVGGTATTTRHDDDGGRSGSDSAKPATSDNKLTKRAKFGLPTSRTRGSSWVSRSGLVYLGGIHEKKVISEDQPRAASYMPRAPSGLEWMYTYSLLRGQATHKNTHTLCLFVNCVLFWQNYGLVIFLIFLLIEYQCHR